MGSGSLAEPVTIFTNAELPNPAFAFNNYSVFPVIFHSKFTIELHANTCPKAMLERGLEPPRHKDTGT